MEAAFPRRSLQHGTQCLNQSHKEADGREHASQCITAQLWKGTLEGVILEVDRLLGKK